MKTFTFYFNELIELWRQYLVEVEAEDYEEALEKCKYRDFDIVDSEELWDTERPAYNKDRHSPTIEIRDGETDDILYDNYAGDDKRNIAMNNSDDETDNEGADNDIDKWRNINND